MSAKLVFPLLVLLASLIIAFLWGITTPLVLILIFSVVGVISGYYEHKGTNTTMTAGQWIWASALSLHVAYSKQVELKPYSVALPQVLATIKSVLTLSHRGTSFWNIRTIDEATGLVQAILQFETDPLRPNDKTTQNTIVLIANVRTDDDGNTIVKFDYEVHANYERRKVCEEVIKDTVSTIEEGIKKLHNPRGKSKRTIP